MSYVKDIFGSSTDSNETFEGFSISEMKKKRRKPPLASNHRSSLELSFFLSKTQPNQELTEPHRKMAAMPMVGLTDQHLDLIVLFLQFTWTLSPDEGNTFS